MLTSEDILSALRDCYDPEVPLNIVDLGLVHRVDIAADPDAPGAGIPGVPQKHRVHLQLTLTSPGCPAQHQITAQIQNRLAGLQEVSNTEVEMIWEPRWSPHRISPAGRRQLELE